MTTAYLNSVMISFGNSEILENWNARFFLNKSVFVWKDIALILWNKIFQNHFALLFFFPSELEVVVFTYNIGNRDFVSSNS